MLFGCDFKVPQNGIHLMFLINCLQGTIQGFFLLVPRLIIDPALISSARFAQISLLNHACHNLF
jgi:hypothetical protein